MPTDIQSQVYDRLCALPKRGLPELKKLLWTDLEYDRANAVLSTRDWSPEARDLLAGGQAPQMVAQQGFGVNAFDIIYTKLDTLQARRDFPLSLGAEREIINRLLADHPYGLFVFSDPNEKYWHFVNVRYDQDAARRRIFRRIAVGPGERVRTAAERIALLNLATLSPSLAGLSPLAIQQRHDEAFDVEPVTRKFFEEYRRVFQVVEAQVTGFGEPEPRRLFVQRLFNRLMFIAFIQKKGWLRFGVKTDYLAALWNDYDQDKAAFKARTGIQPNFYSARLKPLFFAGLNTPNEIDVVGQNRNRILSAVIGDVPYLNGGLFEEDKDDKDGAVGVPDAAIALILHDLFDRFNFTVTESTPLDLEVAVDPEMLGKVFEELVNGRHETGSYYTPKPIVSFMCREALKGYLAARVPNESEEALAAFVDEHDACQVRDPEAVLEAIRTVKTCDPACGSGAYLLGMLHELLDLRAALFAARNVDSMSAYNRKLDIIQNNVYGVDLDPFAINIARLRLWLSLVVDFDDDVPPPLPNLDFKIEAGDSLTGPDPSGGLQPDLFRQGQIEEYFRLKSAFLMAHGEEKRTLKLEVDRLRAKIAAWTRPKGEADGFDWAVEFAEVFSQGGFDVVVANPPYVHMGLIKDYKPALRRIYSAVYTGRADLYVFFYARALQLARGKGMIAFISSNKFMRTQYGNPLRKLLASDTKVQAIVDFGDLPLFEAAAYPAVVVLQKQSPPGDQAVRVLNVVDLSTIDRLSEMVEQSGWLQRQADLNPGGWIFVEPAVLSVIRKLRGTGKHLAEYVQGQVFRGVVTGLNEAFVIDEAMRSNLIAEDPRSADIIRPWLRGRDIKRWRIDYHRLYVLFAYHGIDIRLYPAVLRHLVPFEPALRNRATSAHHEWYELQQPQMGIYRYFDRPKIVYPNICRQPEFAFDEEHLYVNQKCFIIPHSDLFLLGILNSKATFFLFQQTLPKLRGGFYEPGSSFLESFPVPSADPAVRSAITVLVQRLLGTRANTRDIGALEDELNQLVYRAYGLGQEEAETIERSVAMEVAKNKFDIATKALETLGDD